MEESLLKCEFYTDKGVMFRNDCMNVLTFLKPNSVDCIFADPPFNLGKIYNNNKSDNFEDSLYVKWCKLWLNECIRVLKVGGSLFVYHLPRWNVVLAKHLMDTTPLLFRHWIAISMKNGPPRGKRLYPAHYSLVYFTKGLPTVFNRDLVRYPMPKCRHCRKPIPDWGGYKNCLHPLGLNLSDIWTDVSPVRHRNRKTRNLGVNELNPKIPERAILLSTNPGQVILDPFGGGGSTYIVAEKHGRLWVGTEIGDCTPIKNSLEVLSNVKINPPSGIPNKIKTLFIKSLDRL